MEIIYRANDGKEFDDEYDCRTHERELKEQELLNSGIIFLDYYDEKIDTPIYDIEKIYHMYFPTTESIEMFYRDEYDNISEKLSKYETIKPNIWYHWDDCVDQFESDEYKIRQLQDHIEEYDNKLKKVREKNENN